MAQNAEEKLESIRQVLSGLSDPQFWTLDELDEAINKISDIIDPPEDG
jgi:hypothetical protein